jgi:hypothetical protein
MAFSSLCLFVIYIGILPVLQSFFKAIVFNQEDSGREEMGVSMSLEPRGPFSAVDSIMMDVFFSLVGLSALIISCLLVPIFASVRAVFIGKSPVVDLCEFVMVACDYDSRSYVSFSLLPLTLQLLLRPGYLAGVLRAFGIIALVSVISLITSMMPRRLTGSAVGALSVTDVLAGIAADFIYGPIFSHTLRTWPLLYYFLSAGLFTLALVVQYIVWRSSYHQKAK